MFYGFKLGHNVREATKNIYFEKGDSTVDHRTVSRWFKKFRTGCKNIDGQARPGKPKIMYSETVLQDKTVLQEKPGEQYS